MLVEPNEFQWNSKLWACSEQRRRVRLSAESLGLAGLACDRTRQFGFIPLWCAAALAGDHRNPWSRARAAERDELLAGVFCKGFAVLGVDSAKRKCSVKEVIETAGWATDAKRMICIRHGAGDNEPVFDGFRTAVAAEATMIWAQVVAAAVVQPVREFRSLNGGHATAF